LSLYQDVSTFLAWASEPEADERKVCRIHQLLISFAAVVAHA
jgi:cytochrome c1